MTSRRRRSRTAPAARRRCCWRGRRLRDRWRPLRRCERPASSVRVTDPCCHPATASAAAANSAASVGRIITRLAARARGRRRPLPSAIVSASSAAAPRIVSLRPLGHVTSMRLDRRRAPPDRRSRAVRSATVARSGLHHRSRARRPLSRITVTRVADARRDSTSCPRQRTRSCGSGRRRRCAAAAPGRCWS